MLSVKKRREALLVIDVYMAIYTLGFMHSNPATMSAGTAQELHLSIESENWLVS